ncbi:MAG: sugar phosphate nucleotidyltransferase [Myxococcota bacterium]|nr:sugar phosphate nucleotidyltransferase [Myxococcota bacterium]
MNSGQDNPTWVVIMAGGVGSRFWPASTPARPKQLLDLFGKGSMLRMTFDRLLPVAAPERQLVVTGEILGEAVRRELPELPGDHVLEEPVGRNTAAAIAWAAAWLVRQDPDAILAVLPADQFIADEDRYRETVQRAVDFAAASQMIVTLGIRPTRPETGYGYVQLGEVLEGEVHRVSTFREKPDLETAKSYLLDGSFLWNAGMFFMPARVLLEELGRFEPELTADIDALVSDPDADIHEIYPRLKSISIDYAVMERSDRVAVIPGDFGWSDVGSWESLWDFRDAGADSFHQGDVLEIDGGGNVLMSDDGLVATVGVEGLVVVRTPEVTLVCKRQESQRVREVVDALSRQREEGEQK